MTLCRVMGTIVSTAKHPEYEGFKLMVCQPLDEKKNPRGSCIIAVDRVQSGVGDIVLVMREGNGIRQLFKKTIFPVRSAVVGIVDEVDVPQVESTRG